MLLEDQLDAMEACISVLVWWVCFALSLMVYFRQDLEAGYTPYSQGMTLQWIQWKVWGVYHILGCISSPSNLVGLEFKRLTPQNHAQLFSLPALAFCCVPHIILLWSYMTCFVTRLVTKLVLSSSGFLFLSFQKNFDSSRYLWLLGSYRTSIHLCFMNWGIPSGKKVYKCRFHRCSLFFPLRFISLLVFTCFDCSLVPFNILPEVYNYYKWESWSKLLCHYFIGRTEAEAQIFWQPDAKPTH